MHAHGCHPEAGVAFVRDERDAASVCTNEITSSDASLRLHVFLPQMDAGAASDGFWIVVIIDGDAFAEKCLGNLPAIFVDDWFDDVRGLVVVELDDELAEVRLQALNAVFDQERIEVDFLSRHRFGLGQLGDAVTLQDG